MIIGVSQDSGTDAATQDLSLGGNGQNTARLYATCAFIQIAGVHVRQGDVVLRLRLDRGGCLTGRLACRARHRRHWSCRRGLHRAAWQRRFGHALVRTRASTRNEIPCPGRCQHRVQHCRPEPPAGHRRPGPYRSGLGFGGGCGRGTQQRCRVLRAGCSSSRRCRPPRRQVGLGGYGRYASECTDVRPW